MCRTRRSGNGPPTCYTTIRKVSVKKGTKWVGAPCDRNNCSHRDMTQNSVRHGQKSVTSHRTLLCGRVWPMLVSEPRIHSFICTRKVKRRLWLWLVLWLRLLCCFPLGFQLLLHIVFLCWERWCFRKSCQFLSSFDAKWHFAMEGIPFHVDVSLV
jgi:hypothetical protein